MVGAPRTGELKPQMRITRSAIAVAGVMTAAAVILGYVALGALPMFLFAFGFCGGFLWWLYVPSRATFAWIRVPYFLTLALFVAHKWEERVYGFFPTLSDITGVPVPSTDSPLVVALYSLAAAWLLVPYLLRHRHELGYYLVSTFFMSMGTTELAHFAFPLLIDRPYGYFPGMVSVILLAPAAWWGLWRLWCSRTKSSLPAQLPAVPHRDRRTTLGGHQ